MDTNRPQHEWITSDRAENSIMQTITLAVSAIIIASGMIVVPNIVNNNRNDRVRADLVSIGLAEDFQASNTGTYVDNTSVLRSTGGTTIALTPTTWTLISIQSSTGYSIIGVSEAGYVYIINASMDKPFLVGNVELDGEGANKTIKAGSFTIREGSTADQTKASDLMTDGGFTAEKIYAAPRNN